MALDDTEFDYCVPISVVERFGELFIQGFLELMKKLGYKNKRLADQLVEEERDAVVGKQDENEEDLAGSGKRGKEKSGGKEKVKKKNSKSKKEKEQGKGKGKGKEKEKEKKGKDKKGK